MQETHIYVARGGPAELVFEVAAEDRGRTPPAIHPVKFRVEFNVLPPDESILALVFRLYDTPEKMRSLVIALFQSDRMVWPHVGNLVFHLRGAETDVPPWQYEATLLQPTRPRRKSK